MSSQPELLLAAQLRQAGIPFEQEYRFAPPGMFLRPDSKRKRREWRADFFIDHYRHAPLLVEVDGGVWLPKGRHTTGSGFEGDAEKQSAAAILGYRVIRATPSQVEDGRCLSWIRQALGMEAAA